MSGWGRSERQGLQALWQAASLEGQGSAHAAWAIDPATIRICTHPDGTPVKLGQGGFGTVFKAVQDDVRTVAVKISHAEAQAGLTLSREDKAVRDFWEEIQRLADCRDTHILNVSPPSRLWDCRWGLSGVHVHPWAHVQMSCFCAQSTLLFLFVIKNICCLSIRLAVTQSQSPVASLNGSEKKCAVCSSLALQWCRTMSGWSQSSVKEVW